MNRLTISGKDKKPYDYCPTCRNGKEFSEEQHFQTNMLGDNYKEHICGTCNTKYKQPYIPLDIVVENFIAEDISLTDYKEWVRINGGSLTKDNASYHMIRLGLRIKEAKKMLGDKIVEYEKTGKCVEHYLLLSHPFKTAEGNFQIQCCPICNMSKITYKGITYYDKVMNIVRFIAHQGIEFEKAQKVDVPDFNIGTTTEMPDFGVVEQPVW